MEQRKTRKADLERDAEGKKCESRKKLGRMVEKKRGATRRITEMTRRKTKGRKIHEKQK